MEENKKDMFAFIENSRRPINLDYDGNIFEKLLRHLVTGFQICHCDPPQSTHAEFDKVHYELAVAILELFWCGCISQMKENKQRYHSGTTDIFRRILIDAFDAGRKYALIEEEQQKVG
ncbi:MAG: hypothetical protein WAM14_09540 [Candidatus Nitrosopolaris sp.]